MAPRICDEEAVDGAAGADAPEADNARFGSRPLHSVRPSEVCEWVAALQTDGLADSTIYALHARLAHLFSDAVHDGLLAKSPVAGGRLRRHRSRDPT